MCVCVCVIFYIWIGRSLSGGATHPCGNGKMIHPSLICDGRDDCGNATDEHDDCGKIYKDRKQSSFPSI